MPLEQAQRDFLYGIGRAIALHRRQRGWTQDAFAGELGINLKNVQRMESGKHDLRASTLWRVSSVLGIDAPTLLASAAGRAAPAESARRGVRSLERAGWRIQREPAADALLLVDVRARASAPGTHRSDALPRELGWAVPPEGTSVPAGAWLVQVSGPSMQPLIPNGAWCLFVQPVQEVRLGATVLVRAAGDDTTGGAFVVKRIAAAQETPKGLQLTLRSLAVGHPDLTVTATRHEQVLLAEFVRVVASPRP